MMADAVPVEQGPRMARPRMSFLAASRRVFDLSLGEMLWSRRTIFMALVVGGPVLLALIVKGVEMFGMSALRVNGQRVGGFGIFGMIIWWLFLRFIVPVLGVFYGTALMADEVEDKTLTELPTTFGKLVLDLAILGLGLAVYGGVFAFVGAFFKRPLVIGLVFAFGWEQVTLALPGYLKQFTVAYYLQALVPHAMPSDGVTSVLQGMFRDVPPTPVALAWLLIYLGGFLWLATR